MQLSVASPRLLPAMVLAPEERTIIGRSAVMRELLAEIPRVASTDAKVLITGESGVGKDLVASRIHALSPRRHRPFVALNCAALPETLLESELFGHVKGSFTGAYRDRPGRFELAHTGTLFLDEIGEMSPRMQGLLLRVLETGEVQRVGDDRAMQRVDCRVVAATNRDLPRMIETGRFREDLYYRLNVIHVRVPPLRERREDLPLLADFFLAQAVSESQRKRLSPELHRLLAEYPWPGNVRQLQNVIQRLVVTTCSEVLEPVDLPADIRDWFPSPVSDCEWRRAVADRLYEQLKAGGSFWTVVHGRYMNREITRADVQGVVRKALMEARGNYKIVTRLFNVESRDYKRLLNFLRKHDCLLPYREFR